ncbi:MAG: FxsA family protein [Thermoanaerobaculales bacterium]|nr:FxsA family protein [Thermoanaerobaculales bacterium]
MLARLLLLFTVVPLVELALLVQLGRVIGLAPTVAIVLLTGITGAALARWQGLATLRRVQAELAEGRMPAGALVDGLLILVAGAMLLTPGLITDAAGFVLLIPPSRAALRRALVEAFRRRLRVDDQVVIDTTWSAADEADRREPGGPAIDA